MSPAPPIAAGARVAAPMREVQFAGRQRPMLGRFILFLPLLPAAEDQRLRQDAAAVLRGEEGTQRWAALAGWLGAEPELRVQCRRSGLTAALDVRSAADVQLLPLGGGVVAELVYRGGDGGEKRQAVQAVADTGGRTFKLNLPFPDTPAGRSLYAEVVAAMSTPDGMALALSYTHRYRVPAPPPRPVLTADHARVLRDITAVRAQPAAIRADHAVIMPRRRADSEFVRPGIPRPEIPPRHTPPPSPPPPPPPAESPQPVETSFAHALRFALFRRLDDTSAFPDLPRQQQNGWGQVPGREGRKPLHFRDSPRADAFFYLPTAFKLGFYSDGQAGRPPMRAEHYVAEGGQHRVKVTLVALPHIEDAEREELRAYLRDVVLQRMVPFVRLTPAAGLAATFASDLGSGPAEDARTLPAGIRFTAADAIPDERVVLQFDMEAVHYALFCELLRAGLHGQVLLAAAGVSEGIDVHLRLDDVVTNAIGVTQQAEPAPEGAAEGAPPPASPKLAVANLLDLPVELSSVRIGLVDTGEVAGMVFEAEEQELARAQRLEPKAAVTFPIAPRGSIQSWDDTVVALGPVRVDGGSPEDWLDRVHRDPSLQPQAFQVRVQPVLPAQGAERVQFLRLRLYRDGEAAPREERQLLPAAGALELPVRMTLAELAGSAGQAATFSLEYDCLYADGGASLPQRVAIDPEVRDLPLLALLEAPGATYRVEHDGGKPELDRAAAAELIERLRGEGKRWRVYALTQRPAEPPVEPDPVHTPDPQPPDPTPTTGPAVSILTDLLAPAFDGGQLQRAFVVLQPVGAGAASSTLVFDSQNRAQQTWRPTAGTIPPFAYKITYLYAGGTFRQSEGTEAGLVLVLDPPAV